MPTFNLVDEPWIPCLRSAQDPPRLLGLREVFAQAPCLVQLADPAPTVTIALHRLLLAILHRSLQGPCSAEAWAAVWQAGAWDVTAIERYLERWHDRFDLFHPEHPFYQTAGLDPDSLKEVTQLTHERASDRRRPLLFDHTLAGSGLAPDAAARYVVAQQAFSVGGMMSYNPGRDPQGARYAKASPLLGSAVCLVKGETLFQTLMLNWHQYSRDDETPFPFNGDDEPAWEREAPSCPVERLPDGYVDLLTWQSRRMLLAPEELPDGRTMVRYAALMKGYQLRESFEVWSSETMVPYRKRAQAKAGPAWLPLGLDAERTVWRDSHALFRSIAGEQVRPRLLDWLGELIAAGALPEQRVVPLDVYGLIPDQAKVRDWRRESLPLPLALVGTPEIVETLRTALGLAEHAGQLLQPRLLNVPLPDGKPLTGPSPMWILSQALLTENQERTPKRDDIEALARHLSTAPDYWARLESAFRRLVTSLPDDVSVDPFGDRSYGARTLPAWAHDVDKAVRQAFDKAVAGLESSGRTLRAVALAQERFRWCLTRLMAPYNAGAAPKKGDDDDDDGHRP